MRITTEQAVAFSPAFGIDMAAIGTLAGAPGRAASGSFGRVSPGGATAPHQHDEVESFVIVAGDGEVVVDNVAHRVAPGAVIEFEPFETHVLRNTGDDPLVFVDLYWRDPAHAASAATTPGRKRLQGRPVFAFSTPPTPNGDLHLGHLSGPYLAADVFVRFQRMRGVEAYHITGSDDFQSYVVARARQEGSTPQAVAAHYGAEIERTLALLDVVPDQYTVTSTSARYREGLRDFFSRLVASGKVARRRAPALADGVTGEYLYEVDVRGVCPTCKSGTGGNICEECGEPNLCVDIVQAHSNLSDRVPVETVVERYSLPLHEFRDAVLDHHRRGKVSPRLQDLARRVFARPELHLPLTHPAAWGVPPAEPADGEQVIWAWPEMSYGFLFGIEELGRRMGRAWSALQPQRDWKIVHFFGYDNSFYHTLLYPVLYGLAFPEWECDIEYNMNEFYLLDGLKFSTSRRHAIWGKEILTPQTVDAVRYYLAATRGETERTNFERAAFDRVVAERLVDGWQAWLQDLGRRIAGEFDGLAPDAGCWSPVQSAFLGTLQMRLKAVALHYDADGFALNAVMREIDGLVEDAARFSRWHASLARNPALRDEWRTAIALELAAARLLAQVTAPVMPRFSRNLAQQIGLVSFDNWFDAVSLVTPGTPIDLAEAVFFHTEPAREAAPAIA
jgi:methionyl-tRNA synthetase